MCGIFGILYLDQNRPVDSRDLKQMSNTLVHRGPDDEGFFIERNVGLGIRRLSIIDLVTGHQPISNEDDRIWIILNGEIYNFPELRDELEKKGHRFSTKTDTETIVHAYEEYGEDCVHKLNGMFAFAIWDSSKQKLILARDRLGIKPLYYFLDDHCLVFASELKTILKYREIPRSIDLEALDSFFTFEYIPAPLSIFQGIKKLLPGHYMVIQGRDVSLQKYWDIQFGRFEGSEEDFCLELYDLLKDAVRMRLISDVPLGAFLSGGIDSSTIVCMMNEIMNRPVETFSIGFDDASYDELGYARTIAQHFGTNHHELVIKPDVVNWVHDLLRYLDEPMGDFSIFPTYLVSHLARKHVTVALTGDGGDELFAGYDWYIANKIESYYQRLPSALRTRWIPRFVNRIPPSSQKKGFVNKLKRFVEGSVLPNSLQHFRWNMFFTRENKSRLYSEELINSLTHVDTFSRFVTHLEKLRYADPLWQQQFADIKTYLPDDILVKVDRMSMANSLEARIPFLDYRVVEFAAGLPSNMKLNGFKTKYILKKCMAKKLPRVILNRSKEGFSIPMKNWLRKELYSLLQEVLSPERLQNEGLFKPSYIEQLKTEHVRGQANHSHQLWSLMIFEMWRDRYLN